MQWTINSVTRLKNLRRLLANHRWLKNRRSEYRVIEHPNREELARQFSHTWENSCIPALQLAKTKDKIMNWEQTPEMNALVKLVRATHMQEPNILEIGCSSGYYSEVLARAHVPCVYTGCDISDPFVRLARERYPHVPFDVADATALPYRDAQFDMAISGCCILHIFNYEKAIAETARVASRFALFHRTPVLHERPTAYLTKRAYRLDMCEIFFNEQELFKQFRAADLAVVNAITISMEKNIRGLDEPMMVKSYLCIKTAL